MSTRPAMLLLALAAGCDSNPGPATESSPPAPDGGAQVCPAAEPEPDTFYDIRSLPQEPPIPNAKFVYPNLPDVGATELVVFRSQGELEEFATRVGLSGLFAEGIDFEQELVIGGISQPTPAGSYFKVTRVLSLADALEVHLVDYRANQAQTYATPYHLVRVPATSRPIRFYVNGVLAYSEAAQPVEARGELGTGLHDGFLPQTRHYALYIPESRPSPAPLVVLLHGSTIDGRRYIEKFIPLADEFGTVLVAPSSTVGYYWLEHQDFGGVASLVSQLELHADIDSTRVFAGGSSAGGHSVYPLAFEYRPLFRGFFSISGRLNPSVPDCDVAKASGMPVLLMTGDADPLVPLASVEAGKQRLEAAGAVVTFEVVAGGGHNLTQDPNVLRTAFQWMAEQ